MIVHLLSADTTESYSAMCMHTAESEKKTWQVSGGSNQVRYLCIWVNTPFMGENV